MKGNSYMLMHDLNNLKVADLILDWTEKHADSRAPDAQGEVYRTAADYSVELSRHIMPLVEEWEGPNGRLFDR